MRKASEQEGEHGAFEHGAFELGPREQLDASVFFGSPPGSDRAFDATQPQHASPSTVEGNKSVDHRDRWVDASPGKRLAGDPFVVDPLGTLERMADLDPRRPTYPVFSESGTQPGERHFPSIGARRGWTVGKALAASRVGDRLGDA